VLTDVAGRLWPLVLLGVGAAAAFSVRREGLAMTAAIGGAQLGLLTTGAPSLRALVRDRHLLARLAIPHLSSLATVYGLQWALPSTLVPQYSGTSIRNTYRFGQRHLRNVAEVVGLKRPWDRDAIVLGSKVLGTIAEYGLLVAAAAGIVLALWIHRRRDLHLVVFGMVAFAIGGSFRSPLNRYVATVAPLLLLLGLTALVSIPGRRLRRVGYGAALLATCAIVAGNLASIHVRLQNTDKFLAQGAVEFGPTHPSAIEMFDVVVANSDPDDVVAGPKARALTLMTDRRSIQVDQYRPLPDDWTPHLVVVERNSSTEALLLDEEADRYTEIWSNTRFAVFEAR
jgi:hypothetical protein